MRRSAALTSWKDIPTLGTLGKEAPSKPSFDHIVALWSGDMTRLQVEAIVNAANSSLMGGGGIDGAIHRAAGPELASYNADKHKGGCDTGAAVLSPGFGLPASNVISTVGPIGERPKALASCYTACLDVAKTSSIRTVCFPCVSTGIFGYPNKPAAYTALNAVYRWLCAGDNATAVDRIIFCTFMPQDEEIYRDAVWKVFPRHVGGGGGGGDDATLPAAAAPPTSPPTIQSLVGFYRDSFLQLKKRPRL